MHSPPAEIEFSILSYVAGSVEPLLEKFQAETGIRVHLRVMDWETAWNQLVRAAIYNDGPDVSEIGTTWTGDLIGMNVLRPFNTVEVGAMGGQAAFVPVAWKNAVRSGERIWSIPWVSGSRLVYYRRALLEQAVLDPQLAFATPSALDRTLRCLSEQGVRAPWVVATGSTGATLHNLASWVWNAGGDFVSEDGKSMAILSPFALQGMLEYFSLGRYLNPEIQLLTAEAPEAYFSEHDDSAIIISGPWLRIELAGILGERISEIGVAHLPGPSFIGGSNLVIWKYSRQAEAAAQLVRFLSRPENQVRFCPSVGLLPTRIEALKTPEYTSDPFMRVAVETLLKGRTFPDIHLWGVIEERLAAGLTAVWSELLSHPGADPRDVLVRILTPLCRRLDLLLQER